MGFLSKKKGPYEGQVKGKTALRFYHEILGLSDLHFGLWETEDPLTMDGLKTAQKRYTRAVCDLLPHNTHRVIDVGCGTGSVSLALKERGFDVEGLSPDPYQQKVYGERTGLPFHLNWFEKHHPNKTYDAVVMSESCQYVPLDQLFQAVQRHTPSGPLIVADFFVVQPDQGELSVRGHNLSEFERAAKDSGFTITENTDITLQAARTLDLAKHWYDRYGVPTLNLLKENYGSKHPLLLRFSGWLFRHRKAELDKTLEQINSEEFCRVKRYLMMRLEQA